MKQAPLPGDWLKKVKNIPTNTKKEEAMQNDIISFYHANAETAISSLLKTVKHNPAEMGYTYKELCKFMEENEIA